MPPDRTGPVDFDPFEPRLAGHDGSISPREGRKVTLRARFCDGPVTEREDGERAGPVDPARRPRRSSVSPPAYGSDAGSVGRRLHRLGTALLVAGALALAWSVVVWRWQDPATLAYTTYEQHRLSHRLAVVAAAAAAEPISPSPQALAAVAHRFRRSAKPGDPIGRLTVPRLGISYVIVEGTETSSLRLGPGRDERSFMPGEGNLVYIAGHRTTFSAPFAHIDAFRRGDVIRVTMPYATFTYVVTGHTIVAADDLAVLRPRRSDVLALQACHPRFFATQRYIVWARLRSAVTPRGPVAIPASASVRTPARRHHRLTPSAAGATMPAG